MAKVREYAIGGFFDLEIPREEHRILHQESMVFQSARAAFRALLRALKPQKVYIPKYMCDAMLYSLKDEGIEYAWYEINKDFSIATRIDLEEADCILYTNYFGVCQRQVQQVLEDFSPQQVILDYAQALLDAPIQRVLATIYSPRKFLGVPDGGMLVTQVDVNQPELVDNSMDRLQHLLRRLYDEPETHYQYYLEAEADLNDTKPKQMSGLTKRLLASIDYQYIKESRLRNFLHLHEKLKRHNELSLDVDDIIAPLCYPLRVSIAGIRDILLEHRVFIPTYWRDALERMSTEQGEEMVSNLLPLPIDQRYAIQDMDDMINLIMSVIDE